jgi:prevent-host-death family protein
MSVVNIHEAKTHFSRLVDRAAAGEEIVIAKAGRPVARLVAYSPPGPPRAPGGWEGRVTIREDFDDDLPEELAAAFRGDSP